MAKIPIFIALPNVVISFKLLRRYVCSDLSIRSIAALGTAVITTFSTASIAAPLKFDQQEVDQSKFIAVAAPYNFGKSQLMVLEQISFQRSCWRVRGTRPGRVEMLLKDFNFDGICGRSVDGNGYSIRIAGVDLGWKYDLEVVRQGTEYALVGVSSIDRNAPPLQIGKTYGINEGFLKIYLNPGWRFTKRMYEGKPLPHVYITSDNFL